MGEQTGISWADATFNGWIGCTKVAAGCKGCYAERDNKLHKWNGGTWGPGAPRKRTSVENWKKPILWNRKAGETGKRLRVFSASLSDVFDHEAPDAWRDDLFTLIESTPNLDWLILTKRLDEAWSYLWSRGIPKNVWFGTSLAEQPDADAALGKFLRFWSIAPLLWLSIEPLVGPLNVYPFLDDGDGCGVEWVVVGGESGPTARPMHPQWARDIRDACADLNVAFHFKQWGEWSTIYDTADDADLRRVPDMSPTNRRVVNLAGGHGFHGERVVVAERVGKKAAGRLLDGREWNEFPEVRA